MTPFRILRSLLYVSFRMYHTATHCNTLQHTANTLQHTATHCNALQHTTTGIIHARIWLPFVFIGLFCMSLFDSLSNRFVSFASLFLCVLISPFLYFSRLFGGSLFVFIGLFERTSGWRCSWEQRYHVQNTATHCNTLQHTTIYYKTLQHTAKYCNTLQHTATHYITLQHAWNSGFFCRSLLVC